MFSSDRYVIPLPAGHTFPMAKYSLLRARVETLGIVEAEDVREPHAADDAELVRAHDPAYVAKVRGGTLSTEEIRRIGLPWSPALVERSRRSVGGTIEACRAALTDGVAVNLAGGTHHAHRDFGSGYCVFNDVAVAARTLQAEGFARRVLVLDCDVHQGDGTAAIFADDPSVFTFSIHGARNFPMRKPPSDLDVELDDGTDDAVYLAKLADGLARTWNRFAPDLAVYLAGADPFVGDRLGRLAMTREGLARRDRLVLESCRSRDVPVAVVMAGGYGKDIADTVEIQANTVEIASIFFGGTSFP